MGSTSNVDPKTSESEKDEEDRQGSPTVAGIVQFMVSARGCKPLHKSSRTAREILMAFTHDTVRLHHPGLSWHKRIGASCAIPAIS
mmetsp:Transcript_79123/g.149257  ORF Transcript_79123/g.149257 Transcript_79123/m.149257 type:complete len:86 (+) Transcript_79123:254-511(+)